MRRFREIDNDQDIWLRSAALSITQAAAADIYYFPAKYLEWRLCRAEGARIEVAFTV